MTHDFAPDGRPATTSQAEQYAECLRLLMPLTAIVHNGQHQYDMTYNEKQSEPVPHNELQLLWNQPPRYVRVINRVVDGSARFIEELPQVDNQPGTLQTTIYVARNKRAGPAQLISAQYFDLAGTMPRFTMDTLPMAKDETDRPLIVSTDPIGGLVCLSNVMFNGWRMRMQRKKAAIEPTFVLSNAEAEWHLEFLRGLLKDIKSDIG